MPEFRDAPPEDPPYDGVDPPLNGYEEEAAPNFQAIFDAQDFAALISTRQSQKARSYTNKVNSVLKALTIASINAQDFPDAATLMDKGPPFSYAAGQFADSNATFARMVDMLTSPESPTVMFALTSFALVAQIIRNHEAQIKQLPETRRQARARRKAMAGTKTTEPPRFTIRLLGRQIPIRYRSRFKWSRVFGFVRMQTQDPEDLALKVFTNEDVIKALKKQGFTIGHNEPTTPA